MQGNQCITLFSNLLPWTEEKTYKGELVIGEYYNVSTFAGMPFVLTSRMKREIPLYYTLGARQFHCMHMTARDWGFIAINNYIHGKLIWNVNADADALKEQYFRARYANLAQEMKALYEKIEKTTSNCKFYKHYQYLNGKRASLFMRLSADEKLTAENLFPTHHMKLDYRANDAQAGPSLKETLMGLCEAREKLSKIALSTKDETVTLQLQKDMRRLDFGVKMTEFLYLACLVSIGKTEYLEDLRALADNLESNTEAMQGYDFGENFSNALNASWISKTYYERFSKKCVTPRENGLAL